MAGRPRRALAPNEGGAMSHLAQTITNNRLLTSLALEELNFRWLLMAHDRVPGDEVPLTHGSLALMLGVRRAGVTTALHMLESDAAIRGHRSRITVLSRARLEQAAGPSYGVPEREYVRLYGLPHKEGLSAARGLA